MGAKHAKVAEAQRIGDVSKRYHPMGAGFEEHPLLESGGWAPTAWKDSSVFTVDAFRGWARAPTRKVGKSAHKKISFVLFLILTMQRARRRF